MKVKQKKMTDTSEKVINNKNNDYDDNHETTCYDSKYIYILRDTHNWILSYTKP